jgi:L-amino acid N-acyltransferase YncA
MCSQIRPNWISTPRHQGKSGRETAGFQSSRHWKAFAYFYRFPEEGPMTMMVRRARLIDASAIATIYNQGIAERIATFETEPRTALEVESQFDERGERFPTVVAEQGGRVIAWAGASPYSPRPCYAGIAEFSVYVDRDHRGMGVGQTTLSELLQACTHAAIWKVVSRIFPENHSSLNLCRRLGFREVGVYRRHAQLDGVWRDVVIVEILLGEARAAEE